jgi:hypothetical protein
MTILGHICINTCRLAGRFAIVESELLLAIEESEEMEELVEATKRIPFADRKSQENQALRSAMFVPSDLAYLKHCRSLATLLARIEEGAAMFILGDLHVAWSSNNADSDVLLAEMIGVAAKLKELMAI